MVSLMKQPSAIAPLVMSFAALALVLGHAAMFGVVHEADEGTATHIFQLQVLATGSAADTTGPCIASWRCARCNCLRPIAHLANSAMRARSNKSNLWRMFRSCLGWRDGELGYHLRHNRGTFRIY